MKKLFVSIDFGNSSYNVGELFLSEKFGKFVFAYDKDFISTNFEISPYKLQLSKDTYVAENNSDFYNLHSVFADSLPDEWGKKVQDAEFSKIGMDNITALDRLAFIGSYGLGALKFEPSKTFVKAKEISGLAELRKSTQEIISGDLEFISSQLLRIGGSAGGARPKFLVDLNIENNNIRYTQNSYDNNYVPVILKIPNKNDDKYQRIEYCYSLMAKNCGINIPTTYLLGAKENFAHFAIKRFDVLETGERFHTLTFAAMLGVNFRNSNLSYEDLLRTTAEICKNKKDVEDIYKRMLFNYFASNKDDHAKNFSFLMNSKGQWFLSPFYDMAYSPGENGLHQMSVNGKRQNLTITDIKKIAFAFDIKNWVDIKNNVIVSLLKWGSIAKEHNVPIKITKIILQRINENINRIEK